MPRLQVQSLVRAHTRVNQWMHKWVEQQIKVSFSVSQINFFFNFNLRKTLPHELCVSKTHFFTKPILEIGSTDNSGKRDHFKSHLCTYYQHFSMNTSYLPYYTFVKKELGKVPSSISKTHSLAQPFYTTVNLYSLTLILEINIHNQIVNMHTIPTPLPNLLRDRP